MSEALRFHGFSMDRTEHQLEPEDNATATYLVSNQCDCVELTDVEITHADRTDNDGAVVLRCEPAIVRLPGRLAPNEERQVTIKMTTQGHLPGRHALRVHASYRCQPVAPTVDGLFEFDIAPD
jgi:hypothetical protein